MDAYRIKNGLTLVNSLPQQATPFTPEKTTEIPKNTPEKFPGVLCSESLQANARTVFLS